MPAAFRKWRADLLVALWGCKVWHWDDRVVFIDVHRILVVVVAVTVAIAIAIR
jgi:hypothetical protein